RVWTRGAPHLCVFLLFLRSAPDLRPLPPFPTRRSSDLPPLPLRHDGVLRVLGRRDATGEDAEPGERRRGQQRRTGQRGQHPEYTDRKSTRLNSSHRTISYAVFCLKKKKRSTCNATAAAP